MGAPFFGAQKTIEDRPVIADVALPCGAWRIAATPKGGWGPSPNAWFLRLIIIAGGLIVVVPAWLIGRLVEDRRDRAARLRDRERELEKLSRRLELALDTSKV